MAHAFYDCHCHETLARVTFFAALLLAAGAEAACITQPIRGSETAAIEC